MEQNNNKDVFKVHLHFIILGKHNKEAILSNFKISFRIVWICNAPLTLVKLGYSIGIHLLKIVDRLHKSHLVFGYFFIRCTRMMFVWSILTLDHKIGYRLGQVRGI